MPSLPVAVAIVAAPEPFPRPLLMFPIKYPSILETYKKAEASFWTVEEVDLSSNLLHWDTNLTANESQFISHVLAFFPASDGIILENIAGRFMKEVQIVEARVLYGFQITIENIHSEMYSLLLESHIKDPAEKRRLFNAIETITCIARKADWALHWIDGAESFAERIIALPVLKASFSLRAYVLSSS